MLDKEVVDSILNALEEVAFERACKEGKIVEAVLMCNRDDKFMLRQMFRGKNLCIYSTDACGDKIYMVTDKDLANTIREALKYDN